MRAIVILSRCPSLRDQSRTTAVFLGRGVGSGLGVFKYVMRRMCFRALTKLHGWRARDEMSLDRGAGRNSSDRCLRSGLVGVGVGL